MKRKHIKNIKELVKNQKYYQIYNTKLSQFSDGGKEPTFSNIGKTFYRLSDVRRHLGQCENGFYEDSIIVEYNVKVKQVKEVK